MGYTISEATVKKYLVSNGLEKYGYYSKTFGTFSIKFSEDGTLFATLPINSSYQYEFTGTYKIYSGTIYLDWAECEEMHIDYVIDGNNINFDSLERGR